MAVQIQNLPKKNFGQPQFTISCPSWWNSNEQVPQLFSRRISFKVDSSPSPKIYHEAKHLGLQLLDHETSSAQSIGQSQHNTGAVGETNSQDQCFSSESGEDESHGKGVEGKMKPVFFLSPPDSAGNPSQADYGHSKVHDAHSYGDTYCGGFFTSYGSQAVIQPKIVPHIMGMTGARIPLPLNLMDNGPIYVNAKQYHGILRRRQLRAKLEAQNKLVKARKPYLHKSRHLHALNRVRGSGGRFLSSKKLQKPNPSPSTDTISVSDTTQSHQKNVPLDLESWTGTGQSLTSNATCSVASKNGVFGQPDDCFSGISTHVSGRLESNERFICASQPSGESGRRTRPYHRLGNSSLAPSLYLQ